MNNKSKSTMTGALVALSFVSLSGLFGQPPIAEPKNIAIDNIAYGAETNVMDASQIEADSHSRRIRNELSMPYFSFSRVLPKQGL